MSKNIAVTGLSFEFVSLVPSDQVTGIVSITSLPSTRLKADGKAAYVGGIGVSITNVTAPGAGATIPDPGPISGTVQPAAQRVRSECDLVNRLDDESETLTATPQIPGGPTPYPTIFWLKIDNAGQTRALAK